MKKKSFLLGLVLGIVFLLLAIKNTNFSEIISVFAKLEPFWLILGFFFFGLGLLLKTWRWRILLDSHVSPTRIFAALAIGYLVNNLLPARAGELARIYLIGRKENVGISKTLGTVIIEKVFDTFVLVLMLLGLLFSLPNLKEEVKPLFAGFVIPEKWQIRWQLFLSSFKQLQSSKRVITIFSLTVIIWLVEAGWNYTLIRSLDLQVPLAAAFLLVAIVNLGLFIPSPPGYIGVFHFLATFALLPFGVDKSQALSYALLQHTLEYFTLTGLGFWAAIKLSFNPLKEKKWLNL